MANARLGIPPFQGIIGGRVLSVVYRRVLRKVSSGHLPSFVLPGMLVPLAGKYERREADGWMVIYRMVVMEELGEVNQVHSEV